MIVPLSWLSEIVSSKLDTKQAVTAMEQAGIEVEAVEELASLDKNIVSAKVTSVSAHPNADRLKLATVSIGTQTYKVVCGAPNLALGQVVALAKVGAKLPGGEVIKKTEIRGQQSHGMLCSEKELGLSENHQGILELPLSTGVGGPVSKLYGSAETLIDIKTAPNRADLQSLVGIAREVAVQLGRKFNYAQPKLPQAKSLKLVKLTKHEATNNTYQLARLELKKPNQASPGWLMQRLQAAGVRPANLIVDITNYVLLETGQPLHAFDADKVRGLVGPRLAKKGESITTLDGAKRSLAVSDLVIADSSGPIAIAGVMGGQSTEISASTKSILLESANFSGSYVRRTAQSLGLRTEASARFERGLPNELVNIGMGRAVELAGQLKAANLAGIDKQKPKQSKPKVISVSLRRFLQLSGYKPGTKLPLEQLKQLGFGIQTSKDSVRVKPPYWRADVTLAEDVFEELIKLIGLDSVPARLPGLRLEEASYDNFWPRIWSLRGLLTGLGQLEVSTYPFVSEKALKSIGANTSLQPKLQNPRSPEQAYLRPSLATGLLEVARNNSHIMQQAVMYEIARVFTNQRAQPQPKEELKLASLAYGEDAYLNVKVALDGLSRLLHKELELEKLQASTLLAGNLQAAVKAGADRLGIIGLVNPGVLAEYKLSQAAYLEVDVSQLLLHWQMPRLRSPNPYPSALRDVTLIVETHVSYQAVKQVISRPGLSVQYGGDYQSKKTGKHKKALNLHLAFSAAEHTLSEAEISRAEAAVIAKLKAHFGATKQS